MSLAISYTDILDELGRKFGFGATYSVWSSDTTKVADAERFVKSGLRRFYFNAQLPESSPHQWSFLTPMGSLVTEDGTQAYQLPSDFVSMKTAFVIDGGTAAVRLQKRTVAQILEMSRSTSRDGTPEYYAIRSTGKAGGEPQYEVLFYPIPDAAFTLRYRYVLSPPELSTTNPYHLGGPQHSETVLEAILAVGELKLEDAPGRHEERFRECLAMSIMLDKDLADDEPEEDLWVPTGNTLSVDVHYLRRVVGLSMGYGPSPGIWTRKQVEEVKLAIENGLRRFYHPEPVIEDRPRHVWSFLTPTSREVLTQGITEVTLPAGFLDLASESVSFVNSSVRSAVRIGQDTIRKLRDASGLESAPQYVAIRAKASDSETRHEMMLYPTPDQQYTIEYRYLMEPPVISDDNPLPLGGAMHAQTIIESCLASAEAMMGVRDGDHEVKFRKLLASSILMDVQLADPQEEEVWPVADDAATLGVNKAYLRRMIGRTMKISPHPSVWSHAQAKQVQTALEIGLRKFYAPIVLPGEKYSHEWSFLKPLAQISTVSGVHTYPLPDDFAMISGPLTFAPATTSLYPPVEVMGEEYVRYRRQHTEASARPAMACVQPVLADDGTTRYELSLWPTPDTSYTMFYRYQINPHQLSDDVSLPIGGQVHAQTALEACLSAAEEMNGIGQGLHSARFLDCLRASVSHDRKVSSPETMGYNGDGVEPWTWGAWHEHDENVVTYTGYNTN